MSDWLIQLQQGDVKLEQVAEQVIHHPAYVAEIVSGLAADTARIKFGCAKVLRLLAEQRPALLYPHFNFFVSMLDHPNKILQWEAIIVLSHLVRVDSGRKFERHLDKYFAPVSGPVMITAANVIAGGARIARTHPAWADRIARELLKVSRARYQTVECRRIAIGHAITAFEEFVDLLADPAAVIRFVKRQLKNARPATRKKAERFLKQQNKRR